MKPDLSRPQRAMLANAIAGRPLEQGVPRPQPFGPHSTVQALHRKGMLAGINHQPTAAGRAALADPSCSSSASNHGPSSMSTAPQPTPRAAGEAVKAFREYLAVHEIGGRMDGRAVDDMALDLARIALDFPAAVPESYMACDGKHEGPCCDARYCWQEASTDDAVRQAIRDYHFALDNRQHGGVAAGTALDAIQAALGLRWVQGKELAIRAERGAAL